MEEGNLRNVYFFRSLESLDLILAALFLCMVCVFAALSSILNAAEIFFAVGLDLVVLI
jgi:hypothetical protein